MDFHRASPANNRSTERIARSFDIQELLSIPDDDTREGFAILPRERKMTVRRNRVGQCKRSPAKAGPLAVASRIVLRACAVTTTIEPHDTDRLAKEWRSVIVLRQSFRVSVCAY